MCFFHLFQKWLKPSETSSVSTKKHEKPERFETSSCLFLFFPVDSWGVCGYHHEGSQRNRCSHLVPLYRNGGSPGYRKVCEFSWHLGDVVGESCGSWWWKFMRANYNKISDEATRSLEMFGYKYVICWICPAPTLHASDKWRCSMVFRDSLSKM